MAYRRRQQLGKTDSPYSYNYDSALPPDGNASASTASSLAAKAIRASAAYRDSSLSSAYEQSALSSPRDSFPSSAKDSTHHESTPKKSMNESKQGFWGTLARKTKAILDDDNGAQPQEMPERTVLKTSLSAEKGQLHNTYNSSERYPKTESSSLQKGLGAFVSSLSQIGGTIGNALEEGITVMENRTADIIQETRKIQIRKKSGNSVSQNQPSNLGNLRQQPIMQTRGQAQAQSQSQTPTDLEMQLKASRDVAMAMAAKAKLLLRELKTVKADLAFAKERCGQLEEENRILRESREKGDNLEDNDLVRLQLETLLAEKARLARENSVYSRENRFLREIVEYHQLTTQDVVYLDERSEEITEVHPIKTTTTTTTKATNAQSNVTVPTIPKGAISQNNQNVSPVLKEASKIVNPYIQMPAEDLR